VGFSSDSARIFIDPPIERRMIQIDAAFCHDLFEVAIGDRKANVEYTAYRITDFGYCTPLKLINSSILT
jgi:hypothetical protein